MRLDLTDEEARALLRLLTNTVEADRYPLALHPMLRGIWAKLPIAPPDPRPGKPPTPEEREPRRAVVALTAV